MARWEVALKNGYTVLILKNKPKIIQEIQRGLDIAKKVFMRHAQKHWGLKKPSLAYLDKQRWK